MVEINYDDLISTYVNSKTIGSVIAQTILLSRRIFILSCHLKTSKKDLHSKRGLISIVNKRKNLLKYIKNNDEKTYFFIINLLQLRK